MRMKTDCVTGFSRMRFGGGLAALMFLAALASTGSVRAQGAAPAAAPAETAPSSTAPSSTVPSAAAPAATESVPGATSPIAPAAPGAVTVTKTTTTTVSKTDAPGATVVHTDLPADLSVEGMFLAADPIVKVVMGLLALASVATWSIFFYKLIELAGARTRARKDLRAIAAAQTLIQVVASLKKGPVARLARSAELEMEASQALPADGVKERVAIALQRVEGAAARRISSGTGILASVGSTGPFIGLFGTVWGIMNSFIHISNAHTTNLSVVAPGIAEALLATAMGLVAAIPAVLIYNMFSRSIVAYRAILGDASAGIMRHVSRDLDRADARFYTRAAAE